MRCGLSGPNNLTWDSIAASDRRFNRIRQVAPMCPPIWAYWHHLANTSEFVISSTHPNPQPKRQIDRFSRFCTAYTTESLSVLYVMATLSRKLPFLTGALGPHLIHDSWLSLRPQSKRHHDRFSRFRTGDCMQSVPILYSGPPALPPLKIATSMGGWTPI